MTAFRFRLVALVLAALVAPPAGAIEFPTGPAPTINGKVSVSAGEWQADGAGTRFAPNGVGSLMDRGAPTGNVTPKNKTIYTVAPGTTDSVVVRTRRDADNLYFGISVKDTSLPKDNFSNPERVLIAVATRDKAGDPTKKATALLVETARGAKDTQNVPVPDKVTVYQPSGALVGGVIPQGATGWAVVANPPAGAFEARASDPQAGADGYEVEARLSLTALGYPAGGALPNVQVLVVVFNSLDINMDQVAGQGGSELDPAYTHAQLPATGFNGPEYAPDVLAFLNQADYRDTNKWEPGFLSGLGDNVYLGHDPYFWAAYNSIHVGYCDSTKFDDIVPGGPTAYVYPVPVPSGGKIETPKPCGMRIWVRTFRHVAAPPGTPAQPLRALALWGVHGAGIVNTQWKYAALGPIVNVPAGALSFDLPPMTFDPVPADLVVNQHPCILVILVPAENPAGREGFPFADFEKIGKAGGPPDPIKKLNDVYAPSGEQSAQYNIGTVAKNPPKCPDCPKEVPPKVVPSASRDLMPGPLARLDVFAVRQDVPGKGAEDGKGAKVGRPRPVAPLAKNDVVVELRALSTGTLKPAEPARKGRMALIKESGGAIQIVDREAVRPGKDIPLRFNVGNPETNARNVFVHTVVRAPDGLTGLRVAVGQPARVFKPGETVTVTAALTTRKPDGSRETPTDPPVVQPPVIVPPCPCPPVYGPVVRPSTRPHLFFRRR